MHFTRPGTLVLFGVALAGAAHAAPPFKTFSDRLTCGPVAVTVQSTCAEGEDDTTLNTCHPQQMTIASARGTRGVTLPELTKGQRKSYEKLGGSVSDLFLTKMGCARARQAEYVLFYYSIGGGSAPYSELWLAYDKNGALVEDKDFPEGLTSSADFSKMQRVRSIMPR